VRAISSKVKSRRSSLEQRPLASITNEAVADLGIKIGDDDVWAIIKASEVMVG
jgi:hypothetical protein